jgi:glutathione synthase/RimK-type ligase-like ATP-grasp enzyme
MLAGFAILCRDDDDQAHAVLAAATRAGLSALWLDAGGWRRPSAVPGWRPESVVLPASVVWARAMPGWPSKLLPRSEVASADRWHSRIAEHADVERFAYGVVSGWEQSGCVVYPSPQQRVQHQKMAQLRRWHEAGVVIPPSLVTHSIAELRDFVRRAPDKVVVKPLSGAGHAAFLGDDIAVTALDACPVLLQHHIRGDDIRVVVVDGEVVAATHTPVPDDVADGRSVATTAQPLWPSVAHQALAIHAAAVLGHRITALDARRTADGTWVWLESNPTPTVLDVQQVTDVDIATTIAWALQRMAVQSAHHE